jgi:ketosteroid isomerase-like protein
MFVHSFWGKMYLFPEPSRYTNHSAHPTVESNFERMSDYAIRPINKGESITVNATEEIKYELKTFLEAYEKAANSCNFEKVCDLIDDKAVFIYADGTFEGKAAIKKAFEDTWHKIQNETYSISNVKWLKTGYRNAICEYIFTSDGTVNGRRKVYKGKGTNTFKRIKGNWRIVKEHLQKLDEGF